MPVQTTINAIEKEVLDRFKSLLLKKVKLHSLILFGSRARGDADPDSDMDVLVIVNGIDREIEDYISNSAWEAGFEHGVVVVPVVFSRKEWEDSPEHVSLLAQAVRKEGVVV